MKSLPLSFELSNKIVDSFVLALPLFQLHPRQTKRGGLTLSLDPPTGVAVPPKAGESTLDAEPDPPPPFEGNALPSINALASFSERSSWSVRE